MPVALRAALQHDDMLAGRVWATALVAAFLEATPLYCWRLSADDVPLAQQRTLLDGAQAWVAAQLAGGVPAGTPRVVVLAARSTYARWATLHAMGYRDAQAARATLLRRGLRPREAQDACAAVAAAE